MHEGSTDTKPDKEVCPRCWGVKYIVIDPGPYYLGTSSIPVGVCDYCPTCSGTGTKGGE